MHRRTFLGTLGGSGLAATAGCLGVLGSENEIDVDFELIESEEESSAPPEVAVDDEAVTVRGAVKHAPENCSTIELAHAEYGEGLKRLDLLVAPTTDDGLLDDCNDIAVTTGYRAEITLPDEPRLVAATEHHTHGDTSSTTVDLVTD